MIMNLTNPQQLRAQGNQARDFWTANLRRWSYEGQDGR